MEIKTNPEVEQLKQQLREIGKEIGVICNKLRAAGAADAIPDDLLDQLIS